jgi:presequence protease
MDITKHGFRLVSSEELKEIKGTADIYKHDKSGLTMVHLNCADTNKSFAMSFCTPPENSTGVPHILEHSVLAGSDKYPVREPFVELMKGSLNTFLNAFTAGDWTMYPVASQNMQDFLNLVDVYMDAVLNPLIHSTPEIFWQEGWHYEINDDKLSINGVVYNEMKGAMSAPERVIEQELQTALFDNCYGVNSGGDPAVIPELSYEAFCSFHKKLYHPSNALMFLYGDMDLDKVLALADGYLCNYTPSTREHVGSATKLTAPKLITKQYPINAGEDPEGKALYTRGWVVDHRCAKELFAMDVLKDALFNAEAAPVKRAIMQSGVCGNVEAGGDSSIKYPVYELVLNDVDADRFDEINEIVDSTINEIAQVGPDRKLLEACLNRYEFGLREEPAYYPKGIALGMEAASSYIHDDDPISGLRYEETLKFLREQLDTDYYTNLIKKYFIENTWQAEVRLVPEPGLGEKKETENAEKMAALYAKLTDEEKAKIKADQERLRKRQSTPDSEEALETIPQLKLSETGDGPKPIEAEKRDLLSVPTYVNGMFTGGISYITLMFDASCLTKEEIPYASLVCKLLGDMSAGEYGFEQLSTELMLNTGSVGVKLSAYHRAGETQVHPYALIGIKALTSKLQDAIPAICAMLTDTHFDERDRLNEAISMIAAENRSALIEAGNGIAILRLGSYFDPAAMYAELAGGLSFFDFIKKFAAADEAEVGEHIAKLEAVAKKLFVRTNLSVMLSGEQEQYTAAKEAIGRLIDALDEGEKQDNRPAFVKNPKNEAIMTPGDVQYCAEGYDMAELGFSYDGATAVMKNILSTDYLWNRIRVLGGAYGAHLRISQSGTFVLCSYRDPNLENTYKVYDGMAEYLEKFDPSRREMDKYILGTLQELDAPKVGQAAHDAALANYLGGYTKEKQKQLRRDAIATEAKDIRAKAALVKAVTDKHFICTVGNSEKIKAAKDMFSTVIDG